MAEEIARQVNGVVRYVYPLLSQEATLVVLEVSPPANLAIGIARRHPEVIEADLNSAYETQQDPLARHQVALRATGADRVHRFLRGRGVAVAVVDTGVDVAMKT
ncbi:MAG: hypothetical protein N0A24_07150 [Armatimonadetes bacterium]|nr:hypothetical protein [Armatimonadota bacterium]MDW8153978.1 hypothetical protein [Armatimonadota bacterium]